MNRLLVESCNDFIVYNINESYTTLINEAYDSAENSKWWAKIIEFVRRAIVWVKTKILSLFGKFTKNIKALKDRLKNSTLKSDKGLEPALTQISFTLSSIITDSDLLLTSINNNDEGFIEAKIEETKSKNEAYAKIDKSIAEDVKDITLNNYPDCLKLEEILNKAENSIKDMNEKFNNITSKYKNVTDEQAVLVNEIVNINISRVKSCIIHLNTIINNTPLEYWDKRTDVKGADK